MQTGFPGCIIGSETLDYKNGCLRNNFYVQRKNDENNKNKSESDNKSGKFKRHDKILLYFSSFKSSLRYTKSEAPSIFSTVTTAPSGIIFPSEAFALQVRPEI